MRKKINTTLLFTLAVVLIAGLAAGCSDMMSVYLTTDADTAAAALTVEDITFTASETSSTITGNFTLPLTGEVAGTTIAWTVSNTDIVSINDGTATVTQPTDADTEVTLTATITDSKGNTVTKTFVITVLKTSNYIASNIIYGLADSGTAMEVIGYEPGVSGTVTILAEVNSLPVTTIAANAFENLTTITSIALPSSITTIEAAAFKNYSGNVTFPSNSTASLTSIGDEAFYGSGLTLLWLSSATSITAIPDRAFYNCDELASFNFPPALTSIGERAFAELDLLDNVTIPNTVTTIGIGAFQNSIEITSLDLHNIPNIPDYFASGCTALGSVTSYNAIVSIGIDAFDNTGLTYFGMYNDNPPTATADCFTGVTGATLDVTAAGVANFSAPPWDAGTGIFTSVTGNMM